MTDWWLRHPRRLTVGSVGMVCAAIALEVVDLTHATGSGRTVAAVAFLLAAAGSFAGFRVIWQRRRRAGTLVLDPEGQARVARRGLGTGLLIAAALLVLTSVYRGPALESVIFGLAVGLLSAAIVCRLRLARDARGPLPVER
jgi:hypothetical protein